MSSATISYPHSELTAHTGQPTADTLRVTLDELVANTAAIQTLLGGGQHGHSGLVYSAAEYAALTVPPPAAYIVPAQPVFPTPATLAAVVTADPNLTPAIQIVLHQHEQAIVDKANTVETDMRRLLLAAYEPVYFEAFAAAQGKAVGQCSVQELMGHLTSTYGAVRAPEIAQQMLKLKSSYNPAEPIEKYWATINGVVAFATKHMPTATRIAPTKPPMQHGSTAPLFSIVAAVATNSFSAAKTPQKTNDKQGTQSIQPATPITIMKKCYAPTYNLALVIPHQIVAPRPLLQSSLLIPAAQRTFARPLFQSRTNVLPLGPSLSRIPTVHKWYLATRRTSTYRNYRSLRDSST
jgi:hypothetical protein